MNDDKTQTMEFVNSAVDLLWEVDKKEYRSLTYALLALAFAEHRKANALERIANVMESWTGSVEGEHYLWARNFGI